MKVDPDRYFVRIHSEIQRWRHEKRGIRIIAFVIATGAVLTLISFTGRGEKYFDIARNLDIFTTLFKEVNANYVDEIDPKKLIDTGIGGMLESLDPYTITSPKKIWRRAIRNG